MVLLVLIHKFLLAQPGCAGKHPNIVNSFRVCWRYEVAQSQV